MHAWCPYGILKLQAVAISFRTELRKAFVDLIMPFHVNAKLPFVDVTGLIATVGGFSILRLEPSGRIHYLDNSAFTYLHHAYHSISRSLKVIVGEEDLMSSMSSGGGLDDRLGIPDAYQYLERHLPELGPYLMAVAENLKKQKK